MIRKPNILSLIRERRFDEFLEVLTEGFRRNAAEGHRQTLAMKAALETFGGDANRARQYLNLPQELLGGETGFGRARASNKGLAEVLELLKEFDLGTYQLRPRDE